MVDDGSLKIPGEGPSTPLEIRAQSHPSTTERRKCSDLRATRQHELSSESQIDLRQTLREVA